MAITLPTITLKPLSTWEQMQKTRAKLPMPLKILTSLKTTAVLAATLGTLIAPAATGRLAIGALKGAGRFAAKRPLTTILGTGALIASPKLRKDVAALPGKTLKAGKKVGEIYEEPGKAADILGIKEKMSLKEKVIVGLKAAGLVGAAAAVVVGGAAALKKGKEILAARALKKAAQPTEILGPGLRAMGFTEPKPVGLGGVPISQPQKMLTGAPGAPISRPPIQNIIQIQVT